jgi:hypothetical protein
LTKQVAVYDGLVADTEPDVGTTTTVATVFSNGNKVASTDAAPKSCINESVIDPLFKPPILDRKSEPKAVVSMSSLSIESSTLFKFVEKLVPLTLIL